MSLSLEWGARVGAEEGIRDDSGERGRGEVNKIKRQ